MIDINNIFEYEEIYNNDENKIIYYSSSLCFPCMKANILINSLNTDMKKYKVNITKTPIENVNTAPTVLIFNNGKKTKIIGYTLLKEHLSKYI